MTDRRSNRDSRQEPETRKITPAIGIPVERYMSTRAFLQFWQIAQQGFPLLARNYSRCDIHRNEYGRLMLNNRRFSHLIMLDSDHTHPPDVVQRLAQSAAQHPDKLVIGGLNFRRTEPFDPCIFKYDPAGKLRQPVKWGKGLLEVDVLGHGCVIIAREVFERIPPPWWLYEYNGDYSDPSKEYPFPSDDVGFSLLCAKHGIKLWCDTTLTSPHIGETLVGPEPFKEYLAAHPEFIFEEVSKNAEICGSGNIPTGDTGEGLDGRRSEAVQREILGEVGVV